MMAEIKMLLPFMLGFIAGIIFFILCCWYVIKKNRMLNQMKGGTKEDGNKT